MSKFYDGDYIMQTDPKYQPWNELKEKINRQDPTFLKKGLKSGYVCPDCGSGLGENGTGLSLDSNTNHWHCFHCNLYEDNIGLYAKCKKLGNVNDPAIYKKAINELAVFYSLPLPSIRPGVEFKPLKGSKKAINFSDFFRSCAKDLDKTDYTRGITRATLQKFGIGFCDNWKARDNIPGSPRLIIPTSQYSYLARYAGKDPEKVNDKYSKIKMGDLHFFNIKALDDSTRPIYIVEGELDALSIIDLGGEAIALGSCERERAFIDYLKDHKPKAPLIICLDNDSAGQDTTEKLDKDLAKLKIDHCVLNVCGEYKDPNEAIIQNKEHLKTSIVAGEHLANNLNEAKKAEYLTHNSAGALLESFIGKIRGVTSTEYIPTGFNSVDRVLNGGLYPGLICFGAISSAGKTTLVLQMADNMAKSGHDVLIFSLEMARGELMGKSISRITFKTSHDYNQAKKTLEITTGSKYKYYNPEDLKIIDNATNEYRQYADNLFIVEGIGNIGVRQIKKKVQKHIRFTGKTPVIIIDYLQILAPYDYRSTDKQNIDKAVLELKRLSRRYKTPVIVISSFNRENYNKTASNQSFKESGAIEYSADILFALEYQGIDNKSDFDLELEKQKEPREMRLVLLKDRNGQGWGKIPLNYYSAYNYFEETTLDPSIDIEHLEVKKGKSKKKSKGEDLKLAVVDQKPQKTKSSYDLEFLSGFEGGDY